MGLFCKWQRLTKCCTDWLPVKVFLITFIRKGQNQMRRQFLTFSDDYHWLQSTTFLVMWMFWITSIWLFIIFTQHLRSGRIWRKVNFFKAGFNRFELRVFLLLDCCLTKAEEPSLPYYLPIAGGRIIGFITFPRVLVLCEMQSVSSRIWTRVAVSISCDDNHYTKGTSIYMTVHARFGTSLIGVLNLIAKVFQ